VEAVVVLLDYDGTLVPLAPRPELAAPDAEALEIVRELAAAAEVHVVSGRTREVLEAWLGALPVALHAEHGLWTRPVGGAWRARFAPDASWLAEVERAMQRATARAPGSTVERKSASMAWHYRVADPAAAAEALAWLREELAPLPARGLDLLDGACVLEVRDRRANKGAVAREIVASARPAARVVAFGDDTTDEDMFAALPHGALTVKVGGGPTIARERVRDVAAARKRMRRLARGARDVNNDE